MTIPQPQQPRKRKRSGFRFLFTVTVTTVMIATGGFGTFPENSLTQTFQTVISENFSADFLQPFNSYMENISAPTIQPKPASASDQPFDLIGTLVGPANPTTDAASTLSLEEINTSIAQFSSSMTSVSAGTETAIATLSTATLPFTATLIPTLTLAPSETPTLVPTWTFQPVIIYPTNTKKPTSPPPDTETPTNTPSPTPTVGPAGFTLSNISLNTLTNGGAIFAWPGTTFTVNYSYTVWAQSNCSGCIIQLVSGMGSAGVGTTNCAYNGQPGVSPGASGTSSLTLTAPAASGTYDIVVQLQAQTSCANALTAYSGASGIYQKIGQVVVNSAIVDVFNGGTYTGNLGGRAGADALCVAAKPVSVGNPNVRALISISSTDTIAGMPANLGVTNNIPLIFIGGHLIAKDWSDLLDGSINEALTSGGVPAGRWWSGSESDAGNALPTTATCNGFTDGVATGFGNFGDTNSTGAGWMGSASSADCSNTYTLVCLAYP